MLKTRFGLVFLSLIALNTFADDFNPKKFY